MVACTRSIGRAGIGFLQAKIEGRRDAFGIPMLLDDFREFG
jgi:hypothetical protein